MVITVTNKKQLRTVHVTLDITDDEYNRLLTTLATYGAIFEEYGKWFVNNRTTNTTQAHCALYKDQVKKYPDVPTAIIQAARNRVSSSIKSYNSNNKNNKFSKVPKFTARSMSYPKTAVSLNIQGKLTFSLVGGKRARCIINIPKFFCDRYGDWCFQSAYIGIDKNGTPFANLVFTKHLPCKKSSCDIISMDRGVYNIYTTSTGEVKSSKRIRGIKRKYRHNRASLQRKVAHGSRSAKRRLKAQRGKEARFTRNESHIMTKELSIKDNVQTYVLEDLTGIRRRTRSTKFNSMLNSWNFSEFQKLLEYKCASRGISVVYVDPKYTSQMCSQCGYTHKKNRKSDVFQCTSCGFRSHADINAAVNIRDKYISTLPGDESSVRQGASQSPNGAPIIDGRASLTPWVR